MRILYLHQHFGTPKTAGGMYSYEWSRRFAAHGHEVHVITADPSGKGRGWRESEEAGIRIHRYPVPYSNQMSYTRRIAAFCQFAWVAGRQAAAIPADVVIATSTPLTIALPGVYAARKHAVPMVFEVADLWPEMPIAVGALRSRPTIAAARWLERFAYRNAAHIVAQSPGIKAKIAAGGHPEERITVIPSSCDPALFDLPDELGRQFRSRRPWLGDRPLVLYGGSLGRLNGVDYLARVAAAVYRRDAEVRFLIVGGGAQETDVRQVAQELGVLERNFFMQSSIPRTEMPAVLSAADVATSVFLDIKEMWVNGANKVFDALAAGRPVAINHQGWLADLFRTTGAGLVLDVHDVESAADTLVRALRDPAWLSRARAAARQIREQFHRDRMGERFESILANLVSQRPNRMAA
jgi:glycosyltransferase involved in cell wall biosynthesis